MKDKDTFHISPRGNKIPAKQCSISGWKYFSITPFDKLNRNVCFIEEYKADEFRKIHPNCYFINCSCGGLGGTYILVDRKSKKWLNVTDYTAW